MIRLSILAAMIFFVMGGTCDGPQPVLSPQLEHLSAGSVVSCDPYLAKAGAAPLQRRTCLVLANPLRPNLRVFDLSERRFILSSIGYAPLGVRVDGMTSHLVAFEDSESAFVFGLDANSSELFVLNANNAAGLASFSSISTPRFSLSQRPQDVFFAGGDTEGNPQVLIGYLDGSLQLNSYGLATKEWTVKEAGAGLPNVSEIAYDFESGLVAQLVSGAQNSVEIRSITGGSSTFSIGNVGDAKIAIGTLKTQESYAPHLLLMMQDEPKLRIIRLNIADEHIDFDNTLTLPSSVQVAHFPRTSEAVESLNPGGRDWFAAGSTNGKIYFITGENTASSPSPITHIATDLAQTAGGANANGLIQILAANVKILTDEQASKNQLPCSRQLLFVFATGAVVSMCEGSLSGASLIVGRGAK